LAEKLKQREEEISLGPMKRSSTFMQPNKEDEEFENFFPEANEEQILGFIWSTTYKGEKKALPSMNEIILGLYEHVSLFLEDSLKTVDEHRMQLLK
jgi:hypothetical protein